MTKLIIYLIVELILSVTSIALAFVWFGIKAAVIVFLVQFYVNIAIKTYEVSNY